MHVFFDELFNIAIEQVQSVIERVGGSLLTEVDLFDIFEPTGQDPGQLTKSFAFHLTYQSAEATLTDPAVNHLHQAIIDALRVELSAQVR